MSGHGSSASFANTSFSLSALENENEYIYEFSRKHIKGLAGRPGLKKQGRETQEKKKQGEDWEKRSGKKPRSQPRHHTPGKDHRKYYPIKD